jgi:hypothetical protein
MLCLRHKRAGILNIANVHLPADQHANDGTTRDRSMARRKELGAVMAKLQILEQQQHQSAAAACAIPVILGDFNSGEDDPDLFQTGVFQDCWQSCPHRDGGGDQGFTFDWKLNRRADKTRQYGHSERPPRRIDRVYVGEPRGKKNALPPLDAHLLGRNANEDFPPSDHFGVSVSFSIEEHVSQGHILYDPVHACHNAWTAAANPTTESLLALIFEEDSSSFRATKLFDALSSLPIPHLTLLNGFVDLSSDEKTQLATQAVGDAIRKALTIDHSAQIWSLPIKHSSLTLFEHRASATMVCVPDTESEEGTWLNRFYETLRATFPLCHEQESRFAGGWTPHCKLRFKSDEKLR